MLGNGAGAPALVVTALVLLSAPTWLAVDTRNA
jgi:hypothetical protein